MSMTSNRPYLFRAFYEWILDNNCTPYLLVNPKVKGVELPEAYINDDSVVLNLSPQAIHNYQVNNQNIEFNARFGGISTNIKVTMPAVLAIYAKENGQGMYFTPENEPKPPKPTKKTTRSKVSSSSTRRGERPNLRLVKS
jgi:stringent starvation protein B